MIFRKFASHATSTTDHFTPILSILIGFILPQRNKNLHAKVYRFNFILRKFYIFALILCAFVLLLFNVQNYVFSCLLWMQYCIVTECAYNAQSHGSRSIQQVSTKTNLVMIDLFVKYKFFYNFLGLSNVVLKKNNIFEYTKYPLKDFYSRISF